MWEDYRVGRNAILLKETLKEMDRLRSNCSARPEISNACLINLSTKYLRKMSILVFVLTSIRFSVPP